MSLLRRAKQSLSLSESCTGGLLSNAFVSISGASDVFLGALVCYSSQAKVGVAGVSQGAAFENFAVNESCSKEFAKASLDKFNSDYAISTTGFAEDGKEMYLSIVSKDNIWTFSKVFFGNRNDIRLAQVDFALKEFLKILN